MKTITIEILDDTTIKEVEEILSNNHVKFIVPVVKDLETKNANSKNEKYPVSKNIPNAETRKAIEEVEAGIGLTEVKDVNELLLKILG